MDPGDLLAQPVIALFLGSELILAVLLACQALDSDVGIIDLLLCSQGVRVLNTGASIGGNVPYARVGFLSKTTWQSDMIARRGQEILQREATSVLSLVGVYIVQLVRKGTLSWSCGPVPC